MLLQAIEAQSRQPIPDAVSDVLRRSGMKRRRHPWPARAWSHRLLIPMGVSPVMPLQGFDEIPGDHFGGGSLVYMTYLTFDLRRQ